MSQNKGFRHYRNPAFPSQKHAISNKGGVTMAFNSPKHINDLTNADKVEVAFSFCSVDDNFSREHGRAVAEQRLLGATFAIPGDQFQELLHTTNARDLLCSPMTTGLDPEQSIDFCSRVKRAVGPNKWVRRQR